MRDIRQIVVRREGDLVLLIEPWPKHILVTDQFFAYAAERHVCRGGDGFLRFDLDNGWALYGETERDSFYLATHFDLIKWGR